MPYCGKFAGAIFENLLKSEFFTIFSFATKGHDLRPPLLLHARVLLGELSVHFSVEAKEEATIGRRACALP